MGTGWYNVDGQTKRQWNKMENVIQTNQKINSGSLPPGVCAEQFGQAISFLVRPSTCLNYPV